MKTVRCKFLCTSSKKFKGWGGVEFMYAYEMQPVTGTTPENQEFFASTPSGSLSVSAVREDLFEPGQEYYLDFTPVG